MCEGCSFSVSSSTRVILYFLMIILVGVKWYLIAALNCIFLVINDIEDFSLCFLAFVYLPKKNFCLYPFPILKIGLCVFCC